MLPRKTDRKLESFKLFPYLAWGLVVLFVFFVYKLTIELSDNANVLNEQSDSIETKVNVKSSDLKNIDFEQ
ncbi:MAG: hypothetical protein AAB618_03070 [Patescibacteria group bacterium]